jgi:hypothetical protein
MRLKIKFRSHAIDKYYELNRKKIKLSKLKHIIAKHLAGALREGVSANTYKGSKIENKAIQLKIYPKFYAVVCPALGKWEVVTFHENNIPSKEKTREVNPSPRV